MSFVSKFVEKEKEAMERITSGIGDADLGWPRASAVGEKLKIRKQRQRLDVRKDLNARRIQGALKGAFLRRNWSAYVRVISQLKPEVYEE